MCAARFALKHKLVVLVEECGSLSSAHLIWGLPAESRLSDATDARHVKHPLALGSPLANKIPNQVDAGRKDGKGL